MNDVDLYLDALPPIRKEKIHSVIEYIRNAYPDYIESCYYAPKTKFPIFKDKDSHNYVAIASQKSYISIHFTKHNCPQIVASSNKKIKTGVGCVKIPDSVPFPLEDIKQAIDACFKNNFIN